MSAPDRFHTMRLVSTASENADVAVGFTKSALLTFCKFLDIYFLTTTSSSCGLSLYVCFAGTLLLPEQQ